MNSERARGRGGGERDALEGGFLLLGAVLGAVAGPAAQRHGGVGRAQVGLEGLVQGQGVQHGVHLRGREVRERGEGGGG